MKPNEVTTIFQFVENKLWLEVDPLSRFATLHFNLPETRNAISTEIADALAAFTQICEGAQTSHPLTKLMSEGSLGILLIKSHIPGTFMSGGDLKAIASFSHQQGEEFTLKMRRFTHFLRTGPFISIALLNGVAAGGGSEIALACDLRVSLTPGVRIDLAQTRWAVPAGWGMMSSLSACGIYGSERRRGIAVALQESWDLTQLHKLGLLDAQFEMASQPQTAFEDWLNVTIERLASCPPELRAALICQRPQTAPDALAEFDETLFSRFWMGEEHLKRISAFVQKRQSLSKKE